jgi:anaerobic ribonucleoside-triphosphate reductase activating protein
MFNQDGLPLLNIANFVNKTTTLGPGVRAVVWVQGCVFNCPGCISPDWIPQLPARLVSPEDLVDELLADPEVTGFTFSGGEPMLQASGLAKLIHLARLQRDLTLICYTGFTLEQLQGRTPVPSNLQNNKWAKDPSELKLPPGITDLLSEIDVLIDGPYIARQNDNVGLRGSSNQRINHLTDRLKGFDFETQPRRTDIRIIDGYAVLVGVPTRGIEQAFLTAIDEINLKLKQEKE